MLNLGDVINDMVYRIRPYEVAPGATDQAIEEVVDQLANFWRTGSDTRSWRAPQNGFPDLSAEQKTQGFLNTRARHRPPLQQGIRKPDALGARASESVEVDRTRVKPIVKITGEFWAQLTEGDGTSICLPFWNRKAPQDGGTNRRLDHLSALSGSRRTQRRKRASMFPIQTRAGGN